MNERPILDPSPLRDLLDLGVEDAMVQELIALYQEDVPPRMQALREGLASGDLAQIMMESHQMKGALSNLGLMRFADLVACVEAEARAGHLDQAPSIIESLSAAYDESLTALQQAFPPA